MDSTNIFQFFASFKLNFTILPQNSKFWAYSDWHHSFSTLKKKILFGYEIPLCEVHTNATQNMNITNTNISRDFYVQFYLYFTKK